MNLRTWWGVAIVGLLCCRALAQDTVYIAGGTGGQTKISGRVLDYTGSELRLEQAGGREQSFPADRVLRIETRHGRPQTEADALFAQGHFDRALAVYLKAAGSEPRRWVRRQIIAAVVRCYRALDEPARAGEAFLLLIREDAATPYFDCIPLAWRPRQAPVDLELAARQWMKRTEPAAQLLGASHLLSGRDGAAALSRLRRLATGAGADANVAPLALAQTWRAEVATATQTQIDGWQPLIERMPEPLAAGPYFVLGRARAQRRQPQEAALALLRVAILYPGQRALAARSLVEAGRELEKLNRARGALRLYRELMRTYPEQSGAAAEAQSRLEEIAGKR